MLDQLADTDKLALVTFDSMANTVFPPTQLGPRSTGVHDAGTTTRDRLNQMINELGAGGGTNLSDGLFRAIRDLANATDEGLGFCRRGGAAGTGRDLQVRGGISTFVCVHFDFPSPVRQLNFREWIFLKPAE